VIIGGFQEVKF